MIDYMCSLKWRKVRRGRDRMVVRFTTTYVISAYHHWSEFESHSDDLHSIQHYVKKFVSDLRQVGGFLQVLRFLPLIKKNSTATI